MPGFDFLGFNIRSFRVGKRRKKTGTGQVTLVTPSKKSISRHRDQIRAILKLHRTAALGRVIQHLNGTIRSWCEYFRHGNSSQIFNHEDRVLFTQLLQFFRRRHGGKRPKTWLYRHYWVRVGTRLRLQDPDTGTTLISHADFHVLRHIKVKGDASPFDRDLKGYWSRRRTRSGRVRRSEEETPGEARTSDVDPNALPNTSTARSHEPNHARRGAGCGETRSSGSESEAGAVRPRSTVTPKKRRGRLLNRRKDKTTCTTKNKTTT